MACELIVQCPYCDKGNELELRADFICVNCEREVSLKLAQDCMERRYNEAQKVLGTRGNNASQD